MHRKIQDNKARISERFRTSSDPLQVHFGDLQPPLKNPSYQGVLFGRACLDNWERLSRAIARGFDAVSIFDMPEAASAGFASGVAG